MLMLMLMCRRGRGLVVTRCYYSSRGWRRAWGLRLHNRMFRKRSPDVRRSGMHHQAQCVHEEQHGDAKVRQSARTHLLRVGQCLLLLSIRHAVTVPVLLPPLLEPIGPLSIVIFIFVVTLVLGPLVVVVATMLALRLSRCILSSALWCLQCSASGCTCAPHVAKSGIGRCYTFMPERRLDGGGVLGLLR